MLKDCFLSGDWFIVIALHQGPKSTFARLEILLILFWNICASKMKYILFLWYSTSFRRNRWLNHLLKNHHLCSQKYKHWLYFPLYLQDKGTLVFVSCINHYFVHGLLQCMLFSFAIGFDKGLFLESIYLIIFNSSC